MPDAHADVPDAVDVEPARTPEAELADGTGAAIIGASLVSTAVFTVAAVLATAFPDHLRIPVALLDWAFFVAGMLVFLVAFARAIERSRDEVVDVIGVFFLRPEVAPRPVRVRLLGSFAVQVVVAIVTASIRLYTAVAFGILVPMLGLALAGLWGARYGRFPKRAR